MGLSIPAGVGELYDKISILEIKEERVADPKKLAHVKKELELLRAIATDHPADPSLYNELKRVNVKLWDVENALRLKEEQKQFDDEFVRLARSVYVTNDRRAEIKRLINIATSSEIVEVKSYAGSGDDSGK